MTSPLKLWLTIVAGIFLAISSPAVGGASGFEANVSAVSLKASGSHVEGPLVAFLQEQTGSDNALHADPTFTLTANEVRVEIDTADPVIHSGTTYQQVLPTSTSESYTGSIIQGTANRAGYGFDVFSLDESEPAKLDTLSTCGVNPVRLDKI